MVINGKGSINCPGTYICRLSEGEKTYKWRTKKIVIWESTVPTEYYGEGGSVRISETNPLYEYESVRQLGLLLQLQGYSLQT